MLRTAWLVYEFTVIVNLYDIALFMYPELANMRVLTNEDISSHSILVAIFRCFKLIGKKNNCFYMIDEDYLLINEQLFLFFLIKSS